MRRHGQIGFTPTETRTELGSIFSRLKLVLQHHAGDKRGGVKHFLALHCPSGLVWFGVKFFPQLGSRARVTQVTQLQLVWKRARLTWSFLLLCPSDLSTALLLLSSWTACLSWDFSSALTLRTCARASASLTHRVS